MHFGIFTTLNGPGSRAMVTAVLEACRSGDLPGAAVAFVLVNRGPGEADSTDEAVVELARRFDPPIVRSSAYRFARPARQAAREAEAAGDPAPMAAWRDAWFATFRDELPATDVDLALGDLWIWGPAACRQRRGLNLHPALPTGPLGLVWHQVIWRLIAARATHSGVMLHRIIPAVDEGPVASFCRYSLVTPQTSPLWAALPGDPDVLAGLVAQESGLGKTCEHPLFLALRQMGLAREVPLLVATLQAIARGGLRLAGDQVFDATGALVTGGLDLTAAVEASLTRLAGQ